VPGLHNVRNSLAALAVGLDLEVPFDRIQAGLHAFTGVDRRFQVRGEAGGVLVVDDYGHHPTEIRATLEALRTLAGQRRSVVLFQPHRYTRTRFLWDEFCRCFEQADVLLLTDVYPAGEEPILGATSEALAAALRASGQRQVDWVGSLEQAGPRLAEVVREGDVVLTLGAGSVWHAGEDLLAQRRSRGHAGTEKN
jgi:UDP-N-acetylmuramate--alanine ligase